MATFPTATTLTAAQLTGATVVPLSKATARNEITVADLFGAGTTTVIPVYTSDGLLTNSLTTGAITGSLTVRQSGGTPGTDEIQISHNGTDGIIYSLDGKLIARSGGVFEIRNLTNTIVQRGGATSGWWDTYGIRFSSSGSLASMNSAIEPVSAGILKVTDTSSGLGSLIVGAYTASTVGLTVKGAASQSANLQEWQNSSSTVLASVSSAGSLLASGTSIFRQSGGTAGTDEVSVFHDGSIAYWINQDNGASRHTVFGNRSTTGNWYFTSGIGATGSGGVNVCVISSAGALTATTVEAKNGTTPTAVYAYSTYTDASNYARAFIAPGVPSSTTMTLGTEGLGTGASTLASFRMLLSGYSPVDYNYSLGGGWYFPALARLASGVIVGNSATLNQIYTATATLDFGSIAAGTSADLTISVTGAAVGDSVCVGTPAAPDANTTIFGFVSATNTVTVRVVNNQLVGAIDPASGTYRATVLRF